MTQVTTQEGAAIRPTTLEGRFVRLEPLELSHIPALILAASEGRETYGWTFVPDGISAMREYVETAIELRGNRQAVPFATIDRTTGRVLGSTRFANFEHIAWPSANPGQRGAEYPDGVEIGWTWLAASAQRTAVNTEAKYLMLGHAFEAWRVHVVRLKTDRRNERSRAAIQRIGAKLDGIIRADRAASDGALRDTALYSLVEAEWPGAKAALEARLSR
ncbi:MAG: GNAT family protein [Anaerolineaceae bacterium]